jgi:hypothetical protein
MSYDNLPINLLCLVTPQQVRSYALAKGWKRVQNVNHGIALFTRPDSEYAQLIVPMEPSAIDYGKRIADIILTLREMEGRTIPEIISDVMMPDADIVRYRMISPIAEKGVLPLQEGIRILEGAKRSILAAACSVLSPVSFHPRMSRVEANQLLDACEMGQTERGSFTIAIACPLRAVEQNQLLMEGTPPFTRQTTKLLMQSAYKIIRAIESDEVPSLLKSDNDGILLSTNFLDAILQMQPSDEKGILSLSTSWASVLPEPRDFLSNAVNFRREYFPIIEDVCRTLQPSQKPMTSLFVGFVDTLNGAQGPAGEMQGETTFSLFREEETFKARGDLNPRDYQTAIDAHRTAGFVKFRGLLHPGHRIQRVTDITEFELLERPRD